MKMRINHNIAALNTYRQLGSASNAQMKSMEKLSSGLRINRAGDDAAGLAISEKMRGQIRGLDAASRNSQDATSLIQTAEGALNETHSMAQRMRELAVQASNDTNTLEDRQQLNAEFQQLKQEIDDISSQTKFNGKTLLDGNFGNSVDQNSANSTLLAVTGIKSISGSGAAETYTFADDGTDLTVTDVAGNSVTIAGGGTSAGGAQTIRVDEFDITIETNSSFVAGSLDGDVKITGTGTVTFQTGANANEEMTLGIGNMSSSGLGISGNDLLSQGNAESAITNLDTAINSISAERSNLGAKQNRLEHRINNLATSSENLTAAESRIRDVDYALAA
jgi:flagellin